MAWTQVPGGWQRIVSFPNAPDTLAACTGTLVLTSLVNGDTVTYTDSGPNLELNPDKTVTVILPDLIVQRIQAEGGLNLQLDVIEPSGARNTLLGGVYVVNQAGNDLVPKTYAHPRAALKTALQNALTLAELKTAVINYFNAIDP